MTTLGKYEGFGWLINKSGGVGLPLSSAIIYRHDFYDGVTTPQVGSETYSRTGSITYASTNSVLSEVGANVMPLPSFRLNGTETAGGLLLNTPVTNLLVRSEEFENASWSAVGGGSASANTATDPMGGSTADTISGSSTGDGLSQSSSTAAASKRFVFSVYLKSSSGTPNVFIKVGDNTSSEINVTQAQLSTTWQRFEVVQIFSAAASGNVKVQIIVGNTSTVRAWGAQLEDFGSGAFRMKTANPYVRTGAATASAGLSTYSIPNSIVTGVTTKGSFAFWFHSSSDPSDTHSSGGYYPFALNAEKLALIFTAGNKMQLWVSDTPTASSTEFDTWERDQWMHIVATWDTGADSYKLYKNGSLLDADTTALGAIADAGQDLKIGGANGNLYSSDALISQVILWNDVLSADNVAALYSMKSSVYAPPSLDTGKLFSVALGTSPIPTVGNQRHWYNQTKGIAYYDSTTSLAVSAEGSYPIGAYPLNGHSKSGMQISGNVTNLVLQSEAPATTWTAVGTPTITDAVGTFLGTVAYGTINGVANDGIQQSGSGPIAAASNAFIGSVYASVSSGTLAARITVEGDSGGTPETTNADFTATTTPTRYYVYKSFSGAATGNIRLKLTLQGAGTLRLGGMQLQRSGTSGSTYAPVNYPTPYIKTTTGTATSHNNPLVYAPNGNINPAKGSLLAWVCPFFSETEIHTPYGGVVMSYTSGYFEYNASFGGNGGLMNFLYSSATPILTVNETWANSTWLHVAYTWDTTVSPAVFTMYKNGVLVDSDTATRTANSIKNFWIGNMAENTFAPPEGVKEPTGNDFFHGLIDLVEIWGRPLDATEVDAEFDATKAAYGL